MSRTARIRLFWGAAAVIAALYTMACLRLPHFGTAVHPYGDRAVAATLRQRTANTISSINFDQRAFDTLGEESILFGAVLGATALLRRTSHDHNTRPRPVRVLPSTRLFGALLLPVALLTGIYIVAHGQLSPGGGFQGGVVLATALHLAYVAADYRALQRIRPRELLDQADAVAAGAFTVLGLAGLVAGVAYLQNVLPLGTFNTLSSGGLVPVINAAVGIEVASGVIVVLAYFLDQTLFATGPAGGAFRKKAER
ncbi:MnhB domain-containing protein [Streptacidiphilus jiangxiensis]|uniref:Multicomponent Na+:H+ antiporter subunit B n=1 Tax=Streptacidiphilus jiangxiensis TaxID=235985 RepID=A0A1H7H862_STRJI|nr:MnhB domain-containing protein [Streptacidiphilus jiangxiensis]SEK46418.1 multicomponent Na+:H+ antiporter subunit B [Streptacidiphilus jiangxiensis]